MRIEFLAQPDIRVGDLIDASIEELGIPLQLSIVSAFASLPTVLRLKPLITRMQNEGSQVTMTLGVDLGGTSKEVLREVASWQARVWIVKNRMPGTTFHPKIYLLRWARRAEVIVGSNNLTDGGLYRNYEAATRTTFELPDDQQDFDRSTEALAKFLRPTGPVTSELTPEYLEVLTALKEIPSEVEARKARGEQREKRPRTEGTQRAAFGYEPISSAPRLPVELQRFLLSVRNQQQAEFVRTVNRARRSARAAANAGEPLVELLPVPTAPTLPAQLDPDAFFMNPVTSRNPNNPNIPGEQRIPLEALEMAEQFWGWPDNYERTVNPRGGSEEEPRVYQNWKPKWRIYSTDNPQDVRLADVRMYFYANSSDFRFYSGDLVRMQAAAGDVLRFRRVDDDDAVFECVLARRGTPEHNDWQQYLVLETRNNPDRRFGFA